MTLKKVAMEQQATGVCRYVIGPSPKIRLAPRTNEAPPKQ